MSGTQHTSGKLQINHADPLQICDTDGEVRGCAPVARMAEFGSVSERRANARRLVAAWNACDGIETAHLEELGLMAMRMESALVGHLKAQRDELVEALKLAYITMQHMGNVLNNIDAVDDEEDAQHDAAFEFVSAAIAKHARSAS